MSEIRELAQIVQDANLNKGIVVPSWGLPTRQSDTRNKKGSILSSYGDPSTETGKVALRDFVGLWSGWLVVGFMLGGVLGRRSFGGL